MTASLGIWAHGPAADGVIYRWEADEGRDGQGFVYFNPASKAFRPWDGSGFIGDLTVDGDTGDVEGAADEVDRRLFMQVVGAILRAYAKSGEVPVTAHAYFH
jgi:hypothetical protein